MKYNFTESSWISDIKSGSGQLLYEQPVINILGKEVSTLVDLQKSLAQFGVNGGNILSKSIWEFEVNYWVKVYSLIYWDVLKL